MLKIHTADGQTVRIDLSDEAQARELLSKLDSDRYQRTITGASLVETHEAKGRCRACGEKVTCQIGVQYSVSRPQAFRRVEYEVEHMPETERVKGGERIVLFADDMCLTLTAHRSQPSARVTLVTVGKRRYKP